MLLDFLTHYLRPVTFFQSILLATFLFNLRKGNRKQNRLLALLLFSIGIMIGSRVIWWHVPTMERFRPVFVVALDFRFFIGPLFYLYLKSIFKPMEKLKIKDLLHGLVFIIIVILQFIYKAFWLQPWVIFIVVDTLQIAIYILWSFLEFKLIHLFSKSNYFKLDSRFIHWLQFLIISNTVTLGVLIVSWLMSFQVIRIPNWDYWILRLFGFANFIFMNTIVYISLKIPDLFISIKYKNGELPKDVQIRYTIKLTQHMENNKSYLNPLLSLNDLADEISISPKHLSQILNNSFHQNFYQFINAYRIEECKRLLCDETQNDANILGIAYDVGFNSKNSFNSAFKKHTGMTPSEFRKSQKSI